MRARHIAYSPVAKVSYYGDDTIESAREKARARGLQVVFPSSRELQVDIDSAESMAVFLANVDRLNHEGYEVRPSPSRAVGHYHITVRLPYEVTPLERIALQAMLGSDPVREMLSYGRLQRGIDQPTIFFERPRRLPPGRQ